MSVLAVQPDPVLTAFPTTGDRWAPHRVARTQENEQLYRGDFTPLMDGRSKTARNGLLQVLQNQDYIVSNWFRRITEFDVDAIASERPGITSTAPERETFIQANEMALWRRVARTLYLRSVGGYAVLMATTENMLRSIPSDNYFPIVDEFDPELIVAHFLAYDYYDDPTTKTGRHLRCVEIEGDQSEVITYTYDGQTIGGVEERGPGDVAALWVWGDGQDDYTPAVRTLCAEGMVLQTLMAQGLHRHLEPTLAGPASFIQALKAGGQIETELASGLVVPVDINDADPGYFSADINAADALAALQWYNDEVHRETGISPIVEGIGGQGGSAVSFDRLMFKSMARVRRHRRELDWVIPMALDAIGAPDGDTSVTWEADPFASVSERAAMIREDYSTGIIDANEARVARGYAARDADTALPTQQADDET